MHIDRIPSKVAAAARGAPGKANPPQEPHVLTREKATLGKVAADPLASDERVHV
jgi:hypothetical protein